MLPIPKRSILITLAFCLSLSWFLFSCKKEEARITAEVDTVAPTSTSSVITVSDVGATFLTLNWVRATDDQTLQSALTYQVYQSDTNNVGTLAEIDTNGTLVDDPLINMPTKGIVGLTTGVPYYFNVIVSDLSQNRFAYTSVSATPDASGGGGTPAPPGAPSVSNVSIDGSGDSVGTNLTGTHFGYFDPDGDPEASGDHQWYRVDTSTDTNYNPIAGANGPSYTVTNLDAGHFIVYGYTPKDDTNSYGQEVFSATPNYGMMKPAAIFLYNVGTSSGNIVNHQGSCDASKGGLAYSFPFISDASRHIKDRVPGQFANVVVKSQSTNNVIENSWGALWDGGIPLPLVHASLNVLPAGQRWWSGSNASGMYVSGTSCSGWTNGVSGMGVFGDGTSSAALWIFNGSGWSCGSAIYLLCGGY